MTKLLVDILSVDDLTKAQINTVDIWSIPYHLALSNHLLLEEALSSTASKGKTELSLALSSGGMSNKEVTTSAFLSEQLLRLDTTAPFLDRVDSLSIRLNEDHLLEKLQALQKYTSKFKCIASLSFQQATQTTFLNLIASMGFRAIELRPQNDGAHLLKETDIATLGQLISQIREHGLNVGLSGGLEAPDIPRLLPFAPNWLGFQMGALYASNETAKLIRALIPFEEKQSDILTVSNLGTDRLLVSDFIIPMEIGAYGHEFGRQQRVRFNVAADVERRSNNPEDMSHIFSYDLIMDGIRRLAGLGHIELVETLAERIAGFLLAYPRVKRVIVRVEKLDLGPGAVGIEIERHK